MAPSYPQDDDCHTHGYLYEPSDINSPQRNKSLATNGYKLTDNQLFQTYGGAYAQTDAQKNSQPKKATTQAATRYPQQHKCI